MVSGSRFLRSGHLGPEEPRSQKVRRGFGVLAGFADSGI